MTLVNFFSIILYIAFVFYLFFAVYIISVNPKKNLNRIFFHACIAFSIWAFGASVSNNSSEIETALLWRRISVVGWNVAFPLLFHFVLVLTGFYEKIKRKWLYLLIYLPALSMICIFGLFDFTAKNLYNLEFTSVGWINNPIIVMPYMLYDIYFYLYYITYTWIMIFVLFRWNKKAISSDSKYSNRILIVTLIIAIVIGTVFEFFISLIPIAEVPQITPVVMLVPILFIVYMIKYQWFLKENIDNVALPGHILGTEDRVKMYQYVGVLFIFFGLFSFFIEYFLLSFTVAHSLLFHFMIIFFGLVLFFIRKFKNEKIVRGTFYLFVIIFIPIISFRYIDNDNIDSWTVFFIFIIISIVFVKKHMLFLVAGISILTQIIILIINPDIDTSAFVSRLAVVSASTIFAYYVSTIYIYRLNENNKQLSFQKMIGEVSSGFVNTLKDRIEENINNVLAKCGSYFNVDRTIFFSFIEQVGNFEWASEGLEKIAITGLNPVAQSCNWCMNKLSALGIYSIEDIEKMPTEANDVYEVFKKMKLKSIIAVSVLKKEACIGILFLASINKQNEWEKHHKKMLRFIGDLWGEVAERMESEQRLNYLAYYDKLTGLPNTVMFSNRVDSHIKRIKNHNKKIGIFLFDIDNFRTVNDTAGHSSGDKMLQEIVKRIKPILKETNVLSRFSSDEFVFMADIIKKDEEASDMAEKINRVFDKPIVLAGQDYFITASIGIALSDVDGNDSETLIKNAELAMYRAKQKGKNRYIFCTSIMKNENRNKIRMTNYLHHALSKNEFMLYYQPQVSVITKKIVGCEALLRWNHPDYGMVSPSVFIPLAEQNGLIVSIGQWVVMEACKQNKKWQDEGMEPFRMAVNLSVYELRNPNLPGYIEKVLKETKLDPKYLEIEITESATIKGKDYIIEIIGKLKKIGVSIAIDDFGTEYSSLSQLRFLYVDRIKLDMQFVKGLFSNKRDKAIARSIIELAKELNLFTIAEGVETKQQLEYLSEKKCDEIQGYFYYKPMPNDKFEHVMKNHNNRDK